jgi:hypothetical protein
MAQLPFSEDDQTFTDWLWVEVERRGLMDGQFDWNVTLASIVSSVPRRIQPDTDAVLNKELWRMVARRFRGFGIRKYDAVSGSSSDGAGPETVGAWQIALPFLQFIDLQATFLKHALEDVAAIERDVEEWVCAHPEQGATVDSMMGQIRLIAGAA